MSVIEATSTVTKVTVYVDRAMVTRTARIRISPVVRTVRILELPYEFYQESIRIAGRGAASVTIQDFKVALQDLPQIPVKSLQTLEDEKVRLQDLIHAWQDDIAAIDHQKSFLQEIGVGKSRHLSKDLDVQRPSLDDWKSVLDFLGNEQRGLDAAKRELEVKIRKAEVEIRMVDAELSRYANALPKKRRTVTIEVACKGESAREVDYEFEISYLITQAEWKPLYDVRMDSAANSISITYNGLVKQSTGEDWNQAEVLLSTARPKLGGNAPEIRPYKLRNFNLQRGGEHYFSAEPLPPEEAGGEELSLAALDEEDAVDQGASVQKDHGSRVTYRTLSRSDIPGDGSATKLTIMANAFEHKLKYYCVPSEAQYVYLIANIVNNSDFVLLPGTVSIFIDGNFVGNADIKATVNPGEAFEIGLGVDESIKVIRQSTDKVDRTGIFNRSRNHERRIKISLENHSDSAEEVIVRDQIPYSADDHIKVERLSLTPAENPEKDAEELGTGILEWKLNLPPRGKQKIEFGYSVTYPKDWNYIGLGIGTI